MHYRIPLFLLFCAPVASCFQEINTGAATGTAATPAAGGGGGSAGTGTPAPRGGGGTFTPPPQGGGGTSGVGSGGTTPSPDAGTGAGGEAPPPEEEVTLIGTPEIEYVTPDGGAATTTDPCEATTAHATTILLRSCTPCHGGGPGRMQGVPPFDYVLDLERLMGARSTAIPDPTAPPENQDPRLPGFLGMRFLIPGDPVNSRIYFRMSRGEMPPLPADGLPDVRFRPTISDFSVIREWIASCLEEPEVQGDAGDPGGDDAGAVPAP